MNVLIFIHSLNAGGAERVTAHLANQWSQMGWVVTIVTVESTALDFYQIDPAVLRLSLNLARPSQNYLEGARANFRRVTALRKIIQDQKPDLAIGMMTTANITLALACIGLKGLSLVLSEHNYPPKLPAGKVWDFLRKVTYPLANKVTMLTSEGLAWLATEIPRANGVVVPNPIVYPLAATLPTLDPRNYVPDERKLMLAVGRLVPQKGFDILLRAFSAIKDEAPAWDLVIIGEGVLRPALERQISEAGLRQRVSLPGRAGNVADWYRRADLYVMSSRFEGFPMTLGEAMAHGCACISFDCDTGPRDLIRDGVDGILVAPVDCSERLAQKLLEVSRDERMRLELGKNALSVRERYSLDTVLNRWGSIISECRKES